MILPLEAGEFVSSFLGSKERRNSLIAQAIDSSSAVIWTSDMEGTITMCEGGGLEAVGGTPGHCVGFNVRGTTHVPFDEALTRLKKGEHVVRFVVNGLITPTRTVDDESAALFGPWILSMSYLRSASGRPVGIACVTIPVHGSTPLGSYSSCPLGGCVIDGRSHG